MPNFHTGTINASPPTNALVSGTSSTVVPQNINRQGLVITNLSTSTMYLGLAGNAAVLNSGITLMPNGGLWVMDEYNYNNEAVAAIAHSSGNILAIQELIR